MHTAATSEDSAALNDDEAKIPVRARFTGRIASPGACPVTAGASGRAGTTSRHGLVPTGSRVCFCTLRTSRMGSTTPLIS